MSKSQTKRSDRADEERMDAAACDALLLHEAHERALNLVASAVYKFDRPGYRAYTFRRATNGGGA